MTNSISNIDTLFEKTKGQLFFKQGAGFLGALLAQVRFEWNPNIETACISSKCLQWNPDWFLSLDKDSRVSVLAHELWHPGLLHGERLGDRCPDIWNVAGDHVINVRLLEHGYYMDGLLKMFPNMPMDTKYSGWSTDEVYDDLIQNAQGGGGKAGINMPGGGKNGMHGDVVYVDLSDPTSQDQIQQAVGKVIGAMSAARISGRPGDIPGELTLVVDKFLNPKLPWETLLFNWMNELTNQEYSYARPNRRYEDPLLPGQTGRNGLEHLLFGQDISGSITDDQILRFNSELKHVKDELQPELMTMVTFDTKVHDIYVFEKDDPFEKIVITGRGGTDLKDLFRLMVEKQPTAAVIFSDLEVEIPENPGIPILWVCVDSPHASVPYGQLVHLKS